MVTESCVVPKGWGEEIIIENMNFKHIPMFEIYKI